MGICFFLADNLHDVLCKGSRQNREDMTRIDRLDRYGDDDQEELRALEGQKQMRMTQVLERAR
jgi:hypothetical protein